MEIKTFYPQRILKIFFASLLCACSATLQNLEPPASPIPSISAPEQINEPTLLYKGILDENSLDRYINLQYVSDNETGLILWFNGMHGVLLKGLKQSELISAGQTDFGQAMVSLDQNGNGLLFWHSAYPLNLIEEPTSYLYSQRVESYRPIGPVEKHGVFRPLGLDSSTGGNGWLLLNDERPPIRVPTQPPQYPSRLHVIARQFSDNKLQENAKIIFDIPYTNKMSHGFIDSQGNGFVSWYDTSSGSFPQLKVQPFKNFKAEAPAFTLSDKAKERSWMRMQKNNGVLAWIDNEDSSISQTLYVRPIENSTFVQNTYQISLDREIAKAIDGGQIDISLDHRGDGTLVWWSEKKLFSRRVNRFQLLGASQTLENEVSELIQVKVSQNQEGNGIVTWIQRASCYPNCDESHTIKSRSFSHHHF